MLSVFRYDESTLLASRASDKARDERVTWKLKSRGDQELKPRSRPLIDTLGGAGLEVQVISAHSDSRLFSYLRGEFILQPLECRGGLTFSIDLVLKNAPGIVVVLSLCRDELFTDEVEQRVLTVTGDSGRQAVSFALDFDTLSTIREPLFGFIQVGLRTLSGAVVNIGEFSIRQSLPNPNYRPLRIRYDPFGDKTKASSRLRVWKFVEILQQEGHAVAIGGTDYNVDVYIAQKNRPFNVVRAVRAANPAAVIVYDFDDNYTLPEEGVLHEFIAFINFVDVVTCGSEYLASSVRSWHQNVYVLENPVDILAEQLSRRPQGTINRVGWFGAPEGLAELTKAGIETPLETVTKGGDIEFSVTTVDQELIGFDLLLFPLEPSPWNLAKNANRMMKALGLGVPVLVSDTPEHSRIHSLAQLPPDCIVQAGENWDTRIARAREAFEAVEAATATARQIIWEHYSPRAILTALFEHLARTTRLGGAVVRKPRSSSSALGRVAVLMVDTSREDLIGPTLTGSSLDWSAFRQIAVCSARRLHNPPYAYLDNWKVQSQGDFFAAYQEADRFLDTTDAENVLVLPAGVCLGHGALRTLEELVDQTAAPVGLIPYAEFHSAVIRGLSTATPLREFLVAPAPLGPLLVRTAWWREQDVRWCKTLDLWSWAVAVKAMATGAGFAAERLPFAFEVVARPRSTPSRNFAHWLEETNPPMARELPDIDSQWRRVVIDIVTSVAGDVHTELPATVGHLHSEILALRRQLDKAQSEIKALKKK